MIEIAALILTVIGMVLSYPSIKKEWQDHKAKSPKASQVNTLEKINKTKVLKVGCIPYPPFINYERKGRSFEIHDGFYKILMEKLAENAGVSVEFIPVRNDWSLDYLKSGKVHVIACLLRTPERIRKADFAINLHTVSMNGIARIDDDRVTNKSDLRRDDIRIAAVEGESGQEALKDLGVDIDTSNLQLIETDDVSSIFKMVKADMADVAISDGLACLEYLQSERNSPNTLRLLFEEQPILVMACGLMIRQNELDLKAWISQHVETVREDIDVKTAEAKLLTQYGSVVHRM